MKLFRLFIIVSTRELSLDIVVLNFRELVWNGFLWDFCYLGLFYSLFVLMWTYYNVLLKMFSNCQQNYFWRIVFYYVFYISILFQKNCDLLCSSIIMPCEEGLMDSDEFSPCCSFCCCFYIYFIFFVFVSFEIFKNVF